MKPTEVELLKCEACGQFGVVADAVVRQFVCLKCGEPQYGYWLKKRLDDLEKGLGEIQELAEHASWDGRVGP